MRLRASGIRAVERSGLVLPKGSVRRAVLEETVLQLARWLNVATRRDSLCMAGTLDRDRGMSSYLPDHGPSMEVWSQRAAGDAHSSRRRATRSDHVSRLVPRAYSGAKLDGGWYALIEEAETSVQRLRTGTDPLA